MTLTRLDEPSCRKVLAKLDSYIDNELLAESNLEVLEHFRGCASCTGEAQQRRNVRRRLKIAVREAPLPPGLEDRLRQRLRASRQSQTRRLYLMTIAATLAVCVGSWAAYRFRPARLDALLQAGLNDHLHCAERRQRAHPPESPDNQLAAEFQELVPVVRRYVPDDLPFSLAHECEYAGRKYLHLTFRNPDSLLSLIIARKHAGESLSAANLLPALSHSGIPIYAAGAERFQIAAFEEPQYLVFTISDLPARRNLDVLMALAPVVQKFLDKVRA